MIGVLLQVLGPIMPILSAFVSQFNLGDSNPASVGLSKHGCDAWSDDPWTDPMLGTFARDVPKACPKTSIRSQSCCEPSHPHNITMSWIVDNGDHDVFEVDDYRSHELVQLIREYPEKPVIFYVPALFADEFILLEHTALRNAYIRMGFTFVMLTWDELEKGFGQSVANIQVVAKMLSYVMIRSDSVTRSTCIGFSSGSHLCGLAGKYVKEHHQVIPKCYFLDPTGPGFDTVSPEYRLEKSDCGVTVGIHTTGPALTTFPISRLNVVGFGTPLRNAHCSFEINEATDISQPGCLDLRNKNFLLRRSNGVNFNERGPPGQRCAHIRALSLFISALDEACDLYGKASDRMPFPPFDTCTEGMNQVFKVKTTSYEEPFC